MSAQSSLFDSAPLPDICRNRHKNNPESEAANARIQAHKTLLQQRVFNWIQVAGANGATSKEISRALDIPLHSVSGRLSELKKAGQIRKTGERREDAAVLVLAGAP